MTTTSNGVEAARDLTPAQLQLEIARTKSAITDDLRALSERFRPDVLRENAREVMRDARKEATHLLHDAKDVAFGSLIGAKERAIESVQQRVSAIGEQTRQASVLTLEFLTRNRVMLSLLSVGTGLLVYALRGQRLRLPSLRQLPRLRAGRGEPSYRYDGYPLDEPPLQPRAQDSSPFATRRSPPLRSLHQDHRGAVVAVTVLAGLGIGLLLPIGRRPRRALARTGERVWDEAQAAARQGLSQAERSMARVRHALGDHNS